MKKIFSILTLAISVLLISCKGEDGAPGPAGTNGKDGTDGNNADTTLIFDGGWIEGIVTAQRANNSVVKDTFKFAFPDEVFIPVGSNLDVKYWNSYADANSDYNYIRFNVNKADWTVQPINSEFNLKFKLAIDVGGGNLFVCTNETNAGIGADRISNWSVSTDKKLSFDVTVPQSSPIVMDNSKGFYGTIKIRNVPIHAVVTRTGK